MEGRVEILNGLQRLLRRLEEMDRDLGKLCCLLLCLSPAYFVITIDGLQRPLHLRDEFGRALGQHCCLLLRLSLSVNYIIQRGEEFDAIYCALCANPF